MTNAECVTCGRRRADGISTERKARVGEGLATLEGENSRVATVYLTPGLYLVTWIAVGYGEFKVRHEGEQFGTDIADTVISEPGGSGESVLRINTGGPQVVIVKAQDLGWRISFTLPG